MSLQIGSTVLVFDSNHHVVLREIIRETSRSWILLGGRKISKATLEGILTPEQAQEEAR